MLERPDRLLEVGRVAKVHGLRGEVIVELVSDRPGRLSPEAVLWTAEGPLVVATSRRHQARWIVHFRGVGDRNQAQRLVGLRLSAEPVDDDEGVLWVHELVGTLVVDRDGTHRGVVVSVLANPAHELLELDSGALVPVVFVRDCADGITVIEPPEGLFD